MDPTAHFERWWKQEKYELKSEENLKLFFESLTIDLTKRVNEKELLIKQLNTTLIETEKQFKETLNSKSKQLDEISQIVNETITSFKHSSENAIRIGDRLATIESDRIKLVEATEIMKCIRYFERTDTTSFEKSMKNAKSLDSLKRALPKTLKKKTIFELSKVILHL